MSPFSLRGQTVNRRLATVRFRSRLSQPDRPWNRSPLDTGLREREARLMAPLDLGGVNAPSALETCPDDEISGCPRRDRPRAGLANRPGFPSAGLIGSRGQPVDPAAAQGPEVGRQLRALTQHWTGPMSLSPDPVSPEGRKSGSPIREPGRRSAMPTRCPPEVARGSPLLGLLALIIAGAVIAGALL